MMTIQLHNTRFFFALVAGSLGISYASHSSVRGLQQPFTGKIAALVLMDAGIEEEIKAIEDGDVIETSAGLNIKAIASDPSVASVQFDYDEVESFKVESNAPYALCGDSGGNFFTCFELTPGTHTIAATPFSEDGAFGEAGETLTVTFTIVDPVPDELPAPVPPPPPPAPGSSTPIQLKLIYTPTEEVVADLDDGTIFTTQYDISDPSFTVEVAASIAIDAVFFATAGRSETKVPYHRCGDFVPCSDLGAGINTVSVSAYDSAGAIVSTRTITFTIAQGGEPVPNPPPATSAPLPPAPTLAPVMPPSSAPVASPTTSPTDTPTSAPAASPTSMAPVASPTDAPTTRPPTDAPTPKSPTKSPTDAPIATPPTKSPTKEPAFDPPTMSLANGIWKEVQSDAPIVERHEACFVMVGKQAILVGGRGYKVTNIYNPDSRTWTDGAEPPIQMHHMQCVAVQGKLWVMAAWTHWYPNEENAKFVYVYDPSTDTWSTRTALPEPRRRGGAAVIVSPDESKIYVSHGNRGGHETGDHAVSLGYLDEYDVATDSWKALSDDAPHPRDHTGGAWINGRLCIAGGRDGGVNGWPEVAPTDCFDLATGTWQVEADIPQTRGGSAYGTTCDGQLMVAGGEGSGKAWDTVDVFDGSDWTQLDSLVMGRHGTGVAMNCVCNEIYIASGAAAQGGGPEVRSVETFFVSGVDEPCSFD